MVKSPLVYEEMAGIRRGLLDLFDEIVDPPLVARHYAGLLRRYSLGGAVGDVKLKKLFYEIRPALSLLYMRERDFSALPPMDLAGLLAGVALSPDLAALIESLVETKKMTREMGVGPVPPLIAQFLLDTERTFDTLTDQSSAINPARDRERQALAERFYRKTVLEYGAPAGVTAC